MGLSDAAREMLTEVVATCVVCGRPVRRDQPRKLADLDDAAAGSQWWKQERTGGKLVHLECAAVLGGTA